VLGTLIVVIVALNFRRPEKEPHHKVERFYDTKDPQFRREMGVLLGPAIVGGNRIHALQNGDEIFPAMLEGIAAAKRTITFETYIYWSGQIGEQFARALIDRARAGVRVHVMLDWIGCDKMSHQLVAEMKTGGVEVERYHAVHWYSLGRLNNRTHRKVLIIDGSISFTGGVGIADQWLGHAQDPAHWRDMHFKVTGPVAAQMQAAFLDNWIKTTGHVLHGDGYFPAIEASGPQEMQMFISSPEGGSDSMRLMYLTAITAAQRTIDMEAAYFVPDRLMIREMIAARKRGVRIRMLVPGADIDSKVVGIASKREWGPLLESGVGVSFSRYCREKELSLSQWAWVKRVLVRKGIVMERRRVEGSKAKAVGFAAVRVAPTSATVTTIAAATGCRIRHPSGWTIECEGYPEVSWLSALMSGSSVMMRPVGEVKVYLHREPIDMRKGRNGLAALVREGMNQDPFEPDALYVFVGRRYDALKILGWDRNGLLRVVEEDRER
jgi:cardiolipin synthase